MFRPNFGSHGGFTTLKSAFGTPRLAAWPRLRRGQLGTSRAVHQGGKVTWRPKYCGWTKEIDEILIDARQKLGE